jgi:hypothetical protein
MQLVIFLPFPVNYLLFLFVSGEGLSWNWMNVLSHGGYNIYELGDPGGGGS